MNSKSGDFTLVFEGQITSKKGVIEIIEALPLIMREVESTKLLLIGEIREEIEKRKIMSLIEKNNLKEHVKITGWMKHTEIPKFINQGDVGLIIFKPWSYSYITGVPNKLIDYMACGKPVVTSKDFPEIERIVNDSNGGILVNHDDPKQIAEAVIKLLNDDDLRRKMGQNARSYIERNHSWKSFEKRLLGIYRDLGS
jgi:glycosyltransferase involved in cell wall biosynthesis